MGDVSGVSTKDGFWSYSNKTPFGTSDWEEIIQANWTTRKLCFRGIYCNLKPKKKCFSSFLTSDKY